LQELTQRQALVNDLETNLELMTKQKLEYEGDLKQLETIRSIPAGASGRVTDRITLVQQEQVPTEVYFPKLIIMVPAGVILSLALVGGVVFLRETLDQRVKGPSDLALIPRTRIVGMVPHAAEDPSRPAMVETAFTDQPRGVVAEAFRQIRGTVLQRMRTSGHRSLLVVSAMPGSGGSTIAANLAAAMAAADENVLLIDANFRRPSQHRTFKLADAPGLGEVLAGTTPLDAAVRECSSVPNLSLLTAGAGPTRVFERLATERMTAVIAEASSKFDLVIVDAAPAVVSGDARALADRCDASLLVVRAFSEKRGMVARLKNDLADQRADFYGVLINAARSAAGGYFKRNIRATHRYQNNGE
jgi:polysaccharide biosynthesis transport protein